MTSSTGTDITLVKSDQPVTMQSEDRFQRYPFAQRIAQTIKERTNSECLVIGLYGAWGEGKTSVINLIDRDLSTEENTITLKFNPWRFPDETSLLLSFYKSFAKAVDLKLKNTKEKIGDLFKKYAPLLKITELIKGPSLSKFTESIGTLLSQVDIEQLKSRISEFLKNQNKKVVIFIDDIDRLDKEEIYSIFKLVKLNADFSNTTYVLAFDENVVASSIGERFAAGDNTAGKNFLEKIIQVPLHIPVAQPEALQEYAFEILNKILLVNQITFTDQESHRFITIFQESFLRKLDTPRVAIRYGNTLTFSIPLLKGEVNIIDLLCIEGIKIFFPNIYDFIKSNSHYFTDSYQNIYGGGKDKVKVEYIQNKLTELKKNLTPQQSNGISRTLQDIFPILREAFQNDVHGIINQNAWIKNKNITSKEYFGRYFTYTVIKGQVSDLAFEEFIEKVNTLNEENVIEAIKKLTTSGSAANYLFKLRLIEKDLPWDKAQSISSAICQSPEVFPDEQINKSFASQSSFSQAAVFITQILRNHNNKKEAIDFAKTLFERTIALLFSFELVRWINIEDESRERHFSQTEIHEMCEPLFTRIKTDKEQTIFKSDTFHTWQLMLIWSNADRDSLRDFIITLLDESPVNLNKILSVFASTVKLNNYTYTGNFTKNSFVVINNVIDKEKLENTIQKLFKKEEIDDAEPIWKDNEGEFQTSLNLIRQYCYWANGGKETE